MKRNFVGVKALGISTLAFALPLVTFASNEGVGKLIGMAGGIVRGLIPIVIGLGLLVFLWGVLKYVLASSDAGKTEGRVFMLWGIIALFVMVSVWGLVNILRESLDLTNTTPAAPDIPQHPRGPGA